VDASKQKQGKAEALALAKSVRTIHVAKGKKCVTFDMKNDPPDDATILAHLLGPTGNLRAPTIKKGTTLYVGFNEEAYRGLM
jgi:arsenate reductase-like glutaredoxin family protein